MMNYGNNTENQPTKRLSRKEREKQFKKNEILDAAIEIIANKGYQNTTLDEIAEKSEFGKGTLYNYFNSKEDIYKEIIERITKDYINNLKQIEQKAHSFKEFIFLLIQSLFDFAINNRSMFLILYRIKFHINEETDFACSDVIKSMYQELIEIHEFKFYDALKNKEIKNYDKDRIISIIRGITFNHIYQIINRNEEFEVEDETNFLISIIFEGIQKRDKE